MASRLIEAPGVLDSAYCAPARIQVKSKNLKLLFNIFFLVFFFFCSLIHFEIAQARGWEMEQEWLEEAVGGGIVSGSNTKGR